ncbi:MAG: hypothetical protein MHM6MM_008976 [Cercozoa sp. M6MM]
MHLGFPIANDPCYGGQHVSMRLTCGDSEALQQRQISRRELDAKLSECFESTCDSCLILRREREQGSSESGETRFTNDVGTPRSAPDYCKEIWLQAHSYKGEDFHYTARVPNWAEADFDAFAYLGGKARVPRPDEWEARQRDRGRPVGAVSASASSATCTDADAAGDASACDSSMTNSESRQFS